MTKQCTWILVGGVLASICQTLTAEAQAVSGLPASVPGSSGALVAKAGVPAASSVQSSEDQDNILQEIVITAARQRFESSQSAPVADTVLSAKMLEVAHVETLADIASLAPNLQMNKTISSPDAVSIYLRGFGNETNDPSSDPHVAVFLDGIYQPATVGSLLDLFDVSQVEVLGGPQGTLLGRNAPIGAVYVTSQKPTGIWGAELEADYGSYQNMGLRAKLNIPIIDNVLAGKVSLFDKNGGDWFTDLYTGQHLGGEDTQGGRLALEFTPGTAFIWDLTGSLVVQHDPVDAEHSVDYITPYVPGSYSNITQQSAVAGAVLAPGFPALPINVPPADCTIFYVLAGKGCPVYAYGTNGADSTHASSGAVGEVASTMSYRFDPLTVTAVTGYIKYWVEEYSDVDGLPVPGLNSYDDPTNFEEETQELRINSNSKGGLDLNGKLDWLIGGYASNFHYFNGNSLLVLGQPIHDTEHGRTESWAEFGHMIFHVTDPWSFSGGVRYSTDAKFHTYTPSGYTAVYTDPSKRFTNTSFEGGTQYQFDPDKMVYVRFAEGYEAGGFNGLPSVPNGGASYQPETNKAWEVGLKSDWLNKRMRVNFSVFTNDLSNLQVGAAVPISTPPFFEQEIVNSGKATVEGAETAIIVVPIDALTTRLNVGYLHPKYDTYNSSLCSNTIGVNANCAGVPFSRAPRWTIDLGGDYRFLTLANGMSATFNADWDYKSVQYTADPPVPVSLQPGYGLLRLGLRLADGSDKYALEFYGTNVFNKQYVLESTTASGLVSAQVEGRPAEWGVRFTAKLL